MLLKGRKQNGTRTKIVVGVSGGVDSTYAALCLREAGCDVIGVHLKIKSKENDMDAKRMALLQEIAGIPVVVLDSRTLFERNVIRPFLEAYRHGLTPNPCIICNEAFKLRLLIEQATRLGASFVASGHYARICSYKGRHAIGRTKSRKDQTYVLNRLPYEWLSMLRFPMSDVEKPQAREKIADVFRSEGLAGGSESQDICFLEGRPLEAFLRSSLKPDELFAGDMIDETGRCIGKHKGLVFYTEGQRKGLGLSCGPWFVEKRDFKTCRMYLVHEKEPITKRVNFVNASWQQVPVQGKEYSVQTCYRWHPVPARLTHLEEFQGTVEFDNGCPGVSVGQSLVFYDGEILMGGGFITAP